MFKYNKKFFLITHKDFVMELDIHFSYSSDYGYTWHSMNRDDVLLFDDNHIRQAKIFTWKLTSMMIGYGD
jgi:hypothetical protein